MNIEEIKDVIKNTLKQVMENQEVSIEDDDLFYEDLGVDSIAIVQVFLTCQEKYDVVLADELNLMEPVSVNILAEIVERKYKEKEGCV